MNIEAQKMKTDLLKRYTEQELRLMFGSREPEYEDLFEDVGRAVEPDCAGDKNYFVWIGFEYVVNARHSDFK